MMVYSWGFLEMTIPKTIGFDTKMLYLDWMIAYTPILGNLHLSNGVINCAQRLLHLGMQKQAVFWYRPDVEDVKLKHRLKITCAGAESAANLDAGWGLFCFVHWVRLHVPRMFPKERATRCKT